MRIFVTGATGFIGTATSRELIDAGHSVLGLARTDEGKARLVESGIEPWRGNLDDLSSLKAGAERSDAVIHLAFNHDFTRFGANCEDDRRVIGALGETFAGSNRPLVITSGTGIASTGNGAVATEAAPPILSDAMPRAASEEAGSTALAAGANVSVVRLPQVHDTRRQGFVSLLAELARAKGVSAYIGEGTNRWAAAPLGDVARLYRLAIERAEPGAIWHAVAEEGVELRAIATAIGQRLGIPVVSITPAEAEAHFDWLAGFAALDMPASSALTRARLGWEPVGRGLLADLAELEVPVQP